ncbi:hypothetical protein ACIP2Y_45215 [Streptomyces sviceus]
MDGLLSAVRFALERIPDRPELGDGCLAATGLIPNPDNSQVPVRRE